MEPTSRLPHLFAAAVLAASSFPVPQTADAVQPRPLITEIATQGAYGGDYVEIFGMGNYDETLDMSG